MQDPQETVTRVVVIGAGAMGGSMACALARSGAWVEIVDTDSAHVTVIGADGLAVENLGEAGPVAAETMPGEGGRADFVVVMTPAFETAKAAQTAAHVLKAEGSAVSLQNGLGNAEALIDVLGAGRVFMGSTRASADRPAPGRPRITKMDPTSVGELDGSRSARTRWLADALTRGGMPAEVTDNIEGVLWSKFIHNCCINAPSAITGLRMGEVTRVPDLAPIRWQIAEEALAVARAKGIQLEYPDPVPVMQRHVWQKFTKPSMLQHVEQGRLIEIDAINGWLVKEAEALGIDAPVNRIVTALARGRALAEHRAQGVIPDYAGMTAQAEAEIQRGERPWEQL
ncbi:MAG: ketopantoate reductase family protein [Paracoccaceae bacterium]